MRTRGAQLEALGSWYHYYAGLADKLEGRQIPSPNPNYLVYTRREPVGVVAAITPWNSPLLLMTWKVAPALAAGCTVVVKPSEHSPVSTLGFAELFERAGFPPGVVNVVTGSSSEVGAMLARHSGVDKVAFTGSTTTGKAIAHAAADNLSRVSLELGGKSPQIVFPDADLQVRSDRNRDGLRAQDAVLVERLTHAGSTDAEGAHQLAFAAIDVVVLRDKPFLCTELSGRKDAMTEQQPILRRVTGAAGRITLNRPRALNALDLPMIRSMRAALDTWQDDPGVAVVVIDGAGDRAFCAGGDITLVHRSACSDPAVARTLWREEYQLDARIAGYPKPVVTVMDGITMGGGIGIGAHAPVRVATERSVFAMPEVAIGLAPDVGGSLLFARAPGEVGAHLALTAARIGAHDAVYCGLADHVLHSAQLPRLLAALSSLGGPTTAADVHDLVAATHDPPTDSGELAAHRAWIDACYDHATVETILDRLRARPETAAAQAADAIVAAAPTALKVTLQAMHRARSMASLEECLRQDYRLCIRFLAHPDLREGIRAAVIDKDRSPRWHPATLGEVDDATVTRFFTPLDGDELLLP